MNGGSHRRIARTAPLILAVIAVVLGLASTQVRAASAQPYPGYTSSAFYVTINNDNTSAMYTIGYNQGKYDAAHGTNSFVLLDFGGQYPNSGSTFLPYHNGTLTESQIDSFAEQAALGYYTGTGTDTTTIMLLSLGTSNDNYQGTYNSSSVATSAGKQWYSTVDTAYQWAKTHNVGQVEFWAGSDMETEWGGQANTLAWTNGFASVDSSTTGYILYVDYGDAGGCSQTLDNNSKACNGGWTQYGVWYKSFGPAVAFPMPEIYYSVNADQWWRISQYGYYYQSHNLLQFEGPLNETSENTSLEAWNDLAADLVKDAHTVYPMQFSVEIH
jgi:hypothetical protein